MEKVIRQQAAVQQATPEIEPATTVKKQRTIPGIKGDLFRKVTHKLAVLVGFAVVAFVWWVGAQFTLAWVGTTLGFAVDPQSYAWWIIPAAITMLEIGLQPDQKGEGWAQVLWWIVLAVDCFTTYVGGTEIAVVRGWVYPWYFWVFVGVLIALAPEKVGRALWRELQR